MIYANRGVWTVLFGLLTAMGTTAMAQTEFPSQAEVRAKLSPGAQHSWDRKIAEADKASDGRGTIAMRSGTVDSAQDEVGVTTTAAALQTDDQMLQQYRQLKGRSANANAPAAVSVTQVAGSDLDGCAVVAQEAFGSIYNGKLTGYQRVFKCEGQPMVLLSDSALSHGSEVTLISREDANTRVSVRGIERGAVMKRVVSAKTKLGQSALSWRDGDKVVTLLVNDSGDASGQRMKAIAASLK